jgi:hypothetical protein
MFWLLSGIYAVSTAEYPCAKRFFFFFFGCADLETYGGKFHFLIQQVILFVRGNYTSCKKAISSGIIAIVQDGELCRYKMELCTYELW